MVNGGKLREKAIDQWTRELPVKAKRGDIVDCNGVLLAGSKGTYSVYVRTRCVKNPILVAKTLSEFFNLEYNSLYEKISSGKRSEFTIKREVERNVIDKLKNYNLEGVYFSPDNTRVYPYNEMLCQTLGYLSVDGRGQSGIEKYYDNFLRGMDGEILYESDLVGHDIKGKSPRYIPAEKGFNIKLTIDSEVQLICETEMQKVMDKYTPKSAGVIVLEPESGKIRGICQLPSYDLNNIPRDDMEKLNKFGRNGLITDSYEPGSTFKVITASANVNEFLKGNSKAFSLNHIYPSGRYRYVGGRKIKCWSNHSNGKHSNQDLSRALNNSCNPIFVDIALALGKDTMYNYIENFNFGKVTKVDFFGEALGMLVPKEAVTEGDLARIGFGQTIAVTPLQLASAISCVVSGGIYHRPYFVEEIYTEDKIVSKNYPVAGGRVISEKASEIMSGYLEKVVSEGSGKHAFIEGYKVGGKTGTAQKYQNGIISSGKYVMSFAGFFPADEPKYMALVIVDEPVGGNYGSTVAAPVCKNIFQGIINAKNIKQQV